MIDVGVVATAAAIIAVIVLEITFWAVIVAAGLHWNQRRMEKIRLKRRIEDEQE
jgi:hypothetical protein|tara:strand:- start:1398 stop:1559 length:162 start_codon:yes stop_codon:yes gene_type:complete